MVSEENDIHKEVFLLESKLSEQPGPTSKNSEPFYCYLQMNLSLA